MYHVGAPRQAPASDGRAAGPGLYAWKATRNRGDAGRGRPLATNWDFGQNAATMGPVGLVPCLPQLFRLGPGDTREKVFDGSGHP
jgi:hypothetical protein